MLKRRVLLLGVVLICTGLLLLSGCSSSGKGAEQGEKEKGKAAQGVTELTFGSGSLGSVGYTALEAMCNVINRYEPTLKCSAISTAGGPENIVLLFNKKIDVGHTNSSDWFKAYKGEKPFKEKLEPVQLLSYGSTASLIVVKANSNIKSLQDLKGKKLAVGPAGSTLAQAQINYMKVAGIEGIQYVYLSFEEGKDAFISGNVDAYTALFQNGKPYPVTMQVEAATPVRYLPTDPKADKALVDAKVGYVLMDIPKSASKYLENPIPALHTTMVLAVHPDMPEEIAYKITKTLVEHSDDLIKISSDLGAVKPENVTKGLLEGIPVHPGAAKYYKEKGIWSDRLTTTK